MYKKEEVVQNIAFLAALGVVLSSLVFLILSTRTINEAQTPLVEEGVDIYSIQAQNILNQKRAWHKAVEELIQVSNKVVDQPHVSYKFNACFLKDYECVAHSQAYRDEFKKITFYFAPANHTRPLNHVTFYLSLEDEGDPKAILRFSYVGEDWLYMENVSILVDGEVIFEQVLPKTQVRREAVSGSRVYEIGDVLMQEHMDVIKKMADSQTLAVRISGKSGDAHLDEPTLNNVQQQAKEIVLMHELMDAAVNTAIHDELPPGETAP